MASKINGPIGIFDSGIGGLSLVLSVRQELPSESILYYADLKHLPYGEKTAEQVRGYSLDIARHLVAQGAKLLVVACSTASAVATETLRAEIDVPVVTILNPFFLEEVEQLTTKKRIGVVSTRLTHQSQMFARWIGEKNSSIEVVSRPASKLVDLISQGDLNAPQIKEEVEAALAFLVGEEKVDQVILGCTHFNFVEPLFRALLPESVALTSAPKPTARCVRQRLEEKNGLKPDGEAGSIDVETSQYDPIFEQFVKTLHMQPLLKIFL